MNDTAVLDLEQLREITLDDEALMRHVVAALIDDTARQLALLDAAIREQDATRCMHLAHYSKGACANVGAVAAAAILKQIERHACAREFPECEAGLDRLREELDQLRAEAGSLPGRVPQQ